MYINGRRPGCQASGRSLRNSRQSERSRRNCVLSGTGGVVSVMAGLTRREVRAQDGQGLEHLRKLRPPLSRLRRVQVVAIDRVGLTAPSGTRCSIGGDPLDDRRIEPVQEIQHGCAGDRV